MQRVSNSSKRRWQPFQVITSLFLVLALSSTASTLSTDTTAYRSKHSNGRLTHNPFQLQHPFKALGLLRQQVSNMQPHATVAGHLLCSTSVTTSSSSTKLSATSAEMTPSDTPSVATSSSSVTSNTNVSSSQIMQNVKLIVNLLLWYVISAYYNIYNKKALNTFQFPWLIATLQMATGIFLFVPLWLLKLRNIPFRNIQEFRSILLSMMFVGLFTTLSHISGVLSLGLGSVSFVQVIKAAEPLFTALIGGVLLKDILPLRSYLSMIPVIGGVIIASVSELSFSWSCLVAGILSNLFAGARGVFGKKQMQSSPSSSTDGSKVMPKMSAANYYSMLTILSFAMCLPILFLAEGSKLVSLAKTIQTTGLTSSQQQGVQDAIISGVLYYLYNEMSFKVLHHMNPVSHALANTIKRVAVIGLSVVIFHTPITRNGQIGSIIAILGALLYSLVNIKKPKST